MNDKIRNIIIISTLVLVFFSFIGTCTNKANLNNKFDTLIVKIDSLNQENMKLQKSSLNDLNMKLSSKIDASSLQYFLYKDGLDKKEITINSLKSRLKNLQDNK